MSSKKDIERVVLEKIRHYSLMDAICTADKFRNLGMDSLDEVELLIDIEEYFDADLPNDVLDGVDTVEDLINEVEKALR